MADDEVRDDPSGAKLERRMAWEIKRARGVRSENERPIDYSPIVFPDQAGLRHAAAVVISRHLDRPNGKAEAIEVVQALGIGEIYRNGGDGRHAKIQRGPVFKADELDLRPLGYDDEDTGRPDAKERKPRGA